MMTLLVAFRNYANATKNGNNRSRTQTHEVSVMCLTLAIALSCTERRAVPLSLWFQGRKQLVWETVRQLILRFVTTAQVTWGQVRSRRDYKLLLGEKSGRREMYFVAVGQVF